MTSQIGMMNNNSVALASDSAGTWNHTQAYNTSDKIYQLAGRQSVGFMSYGPGGYMGLSWDRIMGMYREHIGTRGDDFKVKELCWITMPIPDEDYEEGLKWFNGEETALDAPHKGPRKGRYQPGYLEDFIRFINTNPHLQDEMTKSNGMLYEIKEDIDFHNIGPTFKALDGLVNLLQQQEKGDCCCCSSSRREMLVLVWACWREVLVLLAASRNLARAELNSLPRARRGGAAS